MWLLLALGCVPAWRPPDVGRFDIEPPPGWSVVRNYRFLGADTLVIAQGSASISVSIRPDHGRAQTLPLDLVASVRALSWGRRVGVENAVLGEQDIVLDGRRACAVTGMRRWRTATMGYTMIVTRTPGQIVELVLHAPFEELNGRTAEWGSFLDHFRLSAPTEGVIPLFSEDTWRR